MNLTGCSYLKTIPTIILVLIACCPRIAAGFYFLSRGPSGETRATISSALKADSFHTPSAVKQTSAAGLCALTAIHRTAESERTTINNHGFLSLMNSGTSQGPTPDINRHTSYTAISNGGPSGEERLSFYTREQLSHVVIGSKEKKVAVLQYSDGTRLAVAETEDKNIYSQIRIDSRGAWAFKNDNIYYRIDPDSAKAERVARLSSVDAFAPVITVADRGKSITAALTGSDGKNQIYQELQDTQVSEENVYLVNGKNVYRAVKLGNNWLPSLRLHIKNPYAPLDEDFESAETSPGAYREIKENPDGSHVIDENIHYEFKSDGNGHYQAVAKKETSELSGTADTAADTAYFRAHNQLLPEYAEDIRAKAPPPEGCTRKTLTIARKDTNGQLHYSRLEIYLADEALSFTNQDNKADVKNNEFDLATSAPALAWISVKYTKDGKSHYSWINLKTLLKYTPIKENTSTQPQTGLILEDEQPPSTASESVNDGKVRLRVPLELKNQEDLEYPYFNLADVTETDLYIPVKEDLSTNVLLVSINDIHQEQRIADTKVSYYGGSGYISAASVLLSTLDTAIIKNNLANFAWKPAFSDPSDYYSLNLSGCFPNENSIINIAEDGPDYRKEDISAEEIIPVKEETAGPEAAARIPARQNHLSGILIEPARVHRIYTLQPREDFVYLEQKEEPSKTILTLRENNSLSLPRTAVTASLETITDPFGFRHEDICCDKLYSLHDFLILKSRAERAAAGKP